MRVRWAGLVQCAVFSLGVLHLAGCGSVVYKDAATTYVTAGRAATKSISEAATSIATGQDKLKAARVAADQFCPIAEPHIYLRDAQVSRQLRAAMSLVPSMPVAGDCQRFMACESNPGGADCASICYSAAESNCITLIEENLALRLQGLSGDDADRFRIATQPVAAAISRIEYGRSAPIQNVLIKQNLEILSAYLDMLEKLATDRKSEVEEDAKKLSKKITDTSDQLTKLTGKQLSVADKATQTQITSAITVMGKFASDLKVIADNAKDAEAIRKLVAERGADVEALIASIQEVATGDALLGTVYLNLGQLQVREALQARYAKTGDAYGRALLLAERDKYAYSDGEKVLASCKQLFEAMSKSHKALIQLVTNPSDKDKQAIANARFQEFKIIAQDVAALIQLIP